MTVKIEMEMPKGCKNCRGLIRSICVLADDIVLKPIKGEDRDKRPSWCPLQEVNNELPQNSACFDCAHTTTCLWLKKHGPCYSCGSKKVKE